jgi:phosphoribosylformylglycinamidine (FGAM) synthase-like enzyme
LSAFGEPQNQWLVKKRKVKLRSIYMSPLELILSEIPESFVAPSARQKIQQYHSAAAERRGLENSAAASRKTKTGLGLFVKIKRILLRF